MKIALFLIVSVAIIGCSKAPSASSTPPASQPSTGAANSADAQATTGSGSNMGTSASGTDADSREAMVEMAYKSGMREIMRQLAILDKEFDTRTSQELTQGHADAANQAANGQPAGDYVKLSKDYLDFLNKHKASREAVLRQIEGLVAPSKFRDFHLVFAQAQRAEADGAFQLMNVLATGDKKAITSFSDEYRLSNQQWEIKVGIELQKLGVSSVEELIKA